MAQRLNIDIVARDKSKQALNGIQNNLQKVRQSVFNLRNAFIGLGAGIVIKGFVDAGIQIENLGVQLKALFGSAKEGEKALKSVTDFARTTPFELKNIQQGITALATVRKQAEASGVSFEELLIITGNTATLLGNDFALASLQIQRSFSAGIGSAELFRERGIKAMAGFKEGQKASVKESIENLRKAFGTGGEYGRLMEDLAQTLFGTISNLKDAFFIFQVEVSKGFFGALTNNLGNLKKTVEDNKQTINEFAEIIGTGLSKAIQGTASVLIFLKDNMTAIIETIKILLAYKLIVFFTNLAIAIRGATIAMLSFNKATKKNLLIAGGAIIISQLDKIIKKIKEIRGITEDTPSSSVDLTSAVDITKKIPEATLADKIRFQFRVLEETINDLNKGALETMRDKLKDIGGIIATSINKGITKVSNGIAKSVLLGENLSDTFRKIAQDIAVKMLSQIIEMGIRLALDVALQNTKLGKMRNQTNELQKQVALQAMLMAMGGGGGGGNGGLFGMFASGGSVPKGKPVVVGENGAELFIPNQAGQITQSARGTGTGNVNVNFTINAVDASGVDKLLIERRGTISRIINESVNERGRNSII